MKSSTKVLLFLVSGVITLYFILNVGNIATEVKYGENQLSNLFFFFILLLFTTGYFIAAFIHISDFIFFFLRVLFKKNIPTLIKIEQKLFQFGRIIHFHKLKSARAVGIIAILYMITAIVTAHFYIDNPGVLIPSVLGMTLIALLLFYGLPIVLTSLVLLYNVFLFILKGQKHRIKPMLREELQILYILRDK